VTGSHFSTRASKALPDLPVRTASLLAPLRHRDFRLLWIGACASLAGDGVYLIALAWQAYTLSHTPTALAVLGVCATVPQLLALLGSGILSDRVQRRLILLGADVIRFVAVLIVAVLVMSGQTRMWQLAVLSVVYGLGAGVAAPAFDAIIPDLVPDQDLQQANALDQFLRPAMLRLGGPALGGVLIAVHGAGTAFLFDAMTFLVSALCLWRMTVGTRAIDPHDLGEVPSLLADALAGVRFVKSRTWLWGTLVSATVAYLLFMGPTEVLLPYLVKEVLHGTASDLGIILGAGGVGAIAAAFIVGQMGLPRRQLTFMYLCWTVAALVVAGYGLASSGWQLMTISLVINGLEAAGTVAWATTKQLLVPTEMLGRVSSLDWFISIAGLPLSYALTAPVAALIGAQTTFIAASVLCAAVTFAALFLPHMRDADGALTAAQQPTPQGQRR
jgi:MFS family permease